MIDSANFTYSRKLQTSTQDVVIRHHILVKRLMSKGGAMHVITIDFIVKLEHALLAIKVINIQVFKHKGLHPIHKLGFAKVKCFNHF